MKSLITLATIAIAFTSSMADASGIRQSSGNCRANNNSTYRQPTNRSQQQQYPRTQATQHQKAQYRVTSKSAESGQTNDGVDYTILVEHPLQGEFVPVTTITGTEQARAYYESVKEQVWLLYRQPGEEQPQLAKLDSAEVAQQAATQLSEAGYEVLGAKPLKFKIERGETKNKSAATNSAYKKTTVSNEAAPAVDPQLKPLLGLWQAVAQDADGKIQTVLMKLEADGFATVSVPNGEGRTTVRKKFSVDDGQFILSDGEAITELGKVVSADANRVVLDRDGRQITFRRP